MTETPEIKKLQLFLALNPSVATTRKIVDAIGRMRSAAERKGLRVSWVPGPNLHVTLKYLGWADAAVVDAVGDRVRELVARRKGFDLQLRGAGAFPDEAHARVLWVGVAPSPALSELAAGVEQVMEKLGFAREKRPYAPHVTVGRVKEGAGAEPVLALVAQTDFGSSLVREVTLYESRVRTTGSEYIALVRAPLDAPPYRAERQTREVEDGSTGQESEDPDGERP